MLRGNSWLRHFFLSPDSVAARRARYYGKMGDPIHHPFLTPMFEDPQFWSGLWKVIIADIVLAGDNAVVIALAVRSLPERQKFWGRIFGSFGAVALRVLFVWIITWLLAVPFLKLVGALLLVWIALKLVQPEHDGEAGAKVHEGNSLGQAIWIIVVADLVMSFDNVMAISAASKGHMGLVIFGLLLSIPLVVFGSGLLSDLMKRYPIIIWLGAGLLGHVAGDMMLTDTRTRIFLGDLAPLLEHKLPIAMAMGIAALGWWLARKKMAKALAATRNSMDEPAASQ
jgi:YjbE family integral membrane protein